MPRAMLYDRINKRVDIMLEQGLVEEARAIYDRNYDRSLPALQGLGYKQLFRVFDGEYTLSEGIEAIKQETRRFAKRQITWFRRCLLYTSPSPRDSIPSRMPSSA